MHCFLFTQKGYYITNVYFFNMLITVLSLTIFAFEATKAQNRIGGTFTLILTRLVFKKNQTPFTYAFFYTYRPLIEQLTFLLL